MTRGVESFRLSLAWKVTLAFGFVVLAALAAFSLLANQAAAREVRGFLAHRPATDRLAWAGALADYYQARGSWDEVGPLLIAPTPLRRMMRAMGFRPSPEGGPMVDMMGPASDELSLADPDGRILAGVLPKGRLLTESELAGATPIRVGPQTVGFLVASTPSETTRAESLIVRLTRGVWLVAGLTGLAALAAGAILVTGLLRPVRELTEASRGLARGDLTRRVPVRSQDEIGELAAAFNQMAGNLEQSEQVRRAMTADIAHELRTPLAVLQANVEALADGVYPPTADNFAPVLDQARLLNRLIEDLRTLALADAGQLELLPVPTALLPLASRVVEGYGQQAQQAGVALSVEGQGATALVDPMRFEQILGNLLTNAIRHTGRGRRVRVQVGGGESAGKAEVTVADEGAGIPDEALPRVFERFYRVDTSRSRAEGGTGLGLAIARQLTLIQGGEIRVANRPEGGAAFTLSFPALTGA
jgi:signal transduction histidine kinase